MKTFLLSLFALASSLIAFGQQGSNYKIDLADFDNYSSKKNIAFYANHIEKLDNSGASAYTSNIFKIPTVVLNQDFIAVSAFVNYLLLDGKISMYYKIKDGKKWGGWNLIPIDEHQNSRLPTIYGLPAYLPTSAKEIQFKIEADEATQFELSMLQFRFYFPGTAPVVEGKKKLENLEKSVNCNCALPAIQYRDDWCPSGNCPKDLTPTATTVSHLIVHHSAGSNTSPNWAATVRSIWDFHVNTQGWDDIGYNFLIDPDGVIYEGRGNDVSGAHFSCMNPGTMGVCLLGNFNTTGPTPEMINSLTELLGWKACDIDQDPRDTTFFATGSVNLVNLCGHRDGNNIPASCTTTACPGNNMYAVMDNLRSSTFNYTQSCSLSPNYSNIVVLGMDATPNPLYANETAQLNIEFRNSGDEDINENLTIRFDIDGNTVGNTSFNSLLMNQTSTSTLNYLFPSSGTYQYCAYIDGASNEFNTSNNSFCVNLDVIARPDTSTAIRDIAEAGINIYPNPTEGLLHIESDLEFTNITLFNSLGQQVHVASVSPLDISDLNDGLYNLVLVADDQRVWSTKIIKK